MKVVKKLCVWIPAVIIIVCIFGFSQQNGEQSMGISYKVSEFLVDVADSIHLIDMKWNDRAHALEQMQTPVRKLAHMAEFALLGFSVYFALKYDEFSYKFTKYVTFFIVLAVASLDEFHQLMVPGRNGNPRDVMIDMCGCLIAIFISVLLDKRKNIVV